MARDIFQFVYRSLMALSDATGLSYNEINIVVYFFVIPFVYICLIDRIRETHRLKLVFLSVSALLLILVPDFEAFADVLFYVSVSFLEVFAFLGLGYVGASVLFCVIIPAIIFAWLFHLAFPSVLPALTGRADAEN